MHKPKHKQKAHPWGPLSEWAWDEARGRWYRVRQDVNGNLDYDWDSRQTPREVEQLTDDLRNLSPASYDHADEYTVSSSKDKSKAKAKSKGKHRLHDEADAARDPYAGTAAAAAGYPTYDEQQCTSSLAPRFSSLTRTDAYGQPSGSYYAQPPSSGIPQRSRVPQASSLTPPGARAGYAGSSSYSEPPDFLYP